MEDRIIILENLVRLLQEDITDLNSKVERLIACVEDKYYT